MGIHGNPFFEHLARLRRSEGEEAPKRLSDFQFFMRHPDFKDAVSERYEEEYPDAPREKMLSLRCRVTREMLEEESEEVRERIKKECDEAHAEDLEAFQDSGEGCPDPDAEAQKE